MYPAELRPAVAVSSRLEGIDAIDRPLAFLPVPFP